MMYLNENEETIIGRFMTHESEYTDKTIILKWSDVNQIIAQYDSFMEDETDYEIDDENYEEFWSFVFKSIEVSGVPPVEISEDGYFLINYHNFPSEILFNEDKIN